MFGCVYASMCVCVCVYIYIYIYIYIYAAIASVPCIWHLDIYMYTHMEYICPSNWFEHLLDSRMYVCTSNTYTVMYICKLMIIYSENWSLTCMEHACMYYVCIMHVCIMYYYACNTYILCMFLFVYLRKWQCMYAYFGVVCSQFS
jgi:hypothetical protein